MTEMDKALRSFKGFLRDQSYRLARRPDWLFPIAHSEPANTHVHSRAAAALLEGGGPSRPWLRWVRNRGDAMNFQRLPGEEHTCAIFADQGRKILSGMDRAFGFAEATIWDAATGQKMASLQGIQAPFAASPSSPLTACADLQKQVHLIDINSLNQIRAFPRETTSIAGLAFSPEARRLACVTEIRSGSAWEDNEPGRLVIWDLHEGLELCSRPCSDTGGYSCVAFSPDGTRVAVGSGKTVLLLDAWTGGLIQSLGGESERISGVAISPDGSLLASAGAELLFWTLESGKAQRLDNPVSSRSFSSIAFSPSGRILAAGCVGGRLDILSMFPIRMLTSVTQAEGVIDSLSFSPTGESLVGGTWKDGVLHWSIPESGFEARDPRTAWAHSDWVRQASIDPTNARVCSLSYYDLIVSDGATGRLLQQVDLEGTFVSISLSPDGRTVACGGFGGRVSVVDIHHGVIDAVLGSGDGIIKTIEYSPDASWLLAGSVEGGIQGWETNGDWSSDWCFPGVAARSLAWSSDGQNVLIGEEDGTVLLLDWAHDLVQPIMPSHSGPAFSLAWSPDGAVFATASWDNTLHLFTRDLEVVTILRGDWGQGFEYYGPPIAFAPDNRHFAWAAGNQLVQVSTIDGAPAGEFEVSSPVLALGWDRPSRLWVVDSGDASGEKPVCYQLDHCFPRPPR